MTEYMHLVGAEEVSRAASRMQEAAVSMRMAAAAFQETADRQRILWNEWLDRFEVILKEHREAQR